MSGGKLSTPVVQMEPIPRALRWGNSCPLGYIIHYGTSSYLVTNPATTGEEIRLCFHFSHVRSSNIIFYYNILVFLLNIIYYRFSVLSTAMLGDFVLLHKGGAPLPVDTVFSTLLVRTNRKQRRPILNSSIMPPPLDGGSWSRICLKQQLNTIACSKCKTGLVSF